MPDLNDAMPVETPPTCGVKRCTKCGAEKAEIEFYVKNKKTGRLSTRCKACDVAHVLEYGRKHPERVWGNKPENQEKKRACFRKMYHNNLDKYRGFGRVTYKKRKVAARAKAKEYYYKHREQQIQKTLAWNKANPEKVKAWKEANRPRIRASVKKHRINHPETGQISRANRRARKMAVPGRLTMGLTRRLMIEQNGKCPYCPTMLFPGNTHKDHIIPLSRGGRHEDRNMQLTCKKCNLRKHAKDPIAFGVEMGILRDPTIVPI